jgi:predicted transport protein
MPIYKQSGNKLVAVKEEKINLEKSLQSLIENNLDELFGLSFVSTEFALNSLRIDTLAFDNETKSFVIIEYKKDRSFSVVDQGYAYLSLLIHNKADFILEYNEKNKHNLKKTDVDWSQTRIIFIANAFTKYQQEAIGFQDMPVELWEVKKYNNGLLLLNEIKPSGKKESIKTVTKNKDIEKVTREVKKYSLSDHIKPGWEKAQDLFEEFSQRVLELDSRIQIRPVKYYIGFNIENKNVVAVRFRKAKLQLSLLRVTPKDIKDPEGKTKYEKNSIKNSNKHITNYFIENEDDIDYAIFLVKQVYKKYFQ